MKWFKEDLYHSKYAQAIVVDKELYKGKSKFQKIFLFENSVLGKVLVLDDIVQTTEVDEFIYHEMLAHCAMSMHRKPKSVLIIGGGDGGTLEEVIKYRTVEKIVMVEIDGAVVDLAKKYLRSICGKAFEDKRTKLIIDDGIKYVQDTKEKFDVVIVDSPDPIGPGKVLFSAKFYKGVYNILNKKGVMSRQTGSTFFQKGELREEMKKVENIFGRVVPYLAPVPTYVGGFFSFILGIKGISCKSYASRARIALSWGNVKKLRYFSPEVFAASTVLPPYALER